MRILIYLFFLLITTSSFAVTFNGKFIQGSFILGKTEPGSEVFIDKKKVKATPDGYFVFGLGRDRKNDVVITINEKKIIIKKLIGDGVLVSTPAGSTAYNLSVHGPILSLNSKKLAITPISAFRPRRWKGKIVSSSSIIKIKNLNNKKKPISVVADNVEVRNINNVKIKVNNHIKFKLLYDRYNSLTKKIKLEQFRKR